MIRARLALSLLSGLALLSATGCGGGPRLRPASGYDLQVDAYLDPALGFLIVVTSETMTTPAPQGSQVVVDGFLTFTPGPQPTSTPMLNTWSCSGPWANFTCTKTLTAPLDDERGYIPLSLPPGTSVTYTVRVRMTGNADPNSTNDSYTFTQP